MLFERFEAKGLAHFSYLVGDGLEAVVIDPRRDCEDYLRKAHEAGVRIAHIFETHRNEDICSGSVELAARSGARIWHADRQLDYRYGSPAADGQEWQIGRLKIRALHTPGHTPGSMSYLLHDGDGHPWAVFCGDTLFAGDVGRTDILGEEKLREMTGLLYDSLFTKLLPLGDGVLLCPAHGPGSVCGTDIADRPWTTIGLERSLNTKLQLTDKEAFIAKAKMLERPPYFVEMEQKNVAGAPLPPWFPALQPLPPGGVRDIPDAVVIDTRSDLSFSAAHIPGAISIWPGGVAGFAGWFLPYNKPLLLLAEPDGLEAATRTLIRMGFDHLAGYLAGGMVAWHKAGYESRSVATVTVGELCRRLDGGGTPWILDVRAAEELERDGRIPGAHHIHLTQLPLHLDRIPPHEHVYIFCASGVRSMTAASLLLRHNISNVTVVLGGFSGWTSVTCPIQN